MWSIIIVLIIGITIGILVNPTEQFKKRISQLQFLGVTLLLFAMGAGLGLNQDLLNNLKEIGLVGFIFALLTTLFSIACVFITTSLYGRKNK